MNTARSAPDGHWGRNVTGRSSPVALRLTADVKVLRGSFALAAGLDVGAGEVLAVLGPNGAGKTSLLRALAGLQPLSAGRIALGGHVLDEPAAGLFVAPHQRRVGVVFQDYLLFGHLDVLDNVAFGLRSRGLSRAGSRRLAGPWLPRLGLDGIAHRRPGQLSGGQSQRVALARALATEPDLMLLDEPLAAVDARSRLDLRSDLRRHLVEFGGPSVLVTHDALEALMLADQVAVIEDGHVVQRGRTAEVARRPATDYVARLLGLNLYRGTARAGTVELDSGGAVRIPDSHLSGDVLVTIRPTAVALHREAPEGSARNVWRGNVSGVQPVGDRVRVAMTATPSVLVDVTAAAMSDLALAPGLELWMSVKATEVDAYPAAHQQ